MRPSDSSASCQDLVVQEDVGILEHRHLLVRIVDEVGRDMATIELHAFDELKLCRRG
jgi:hypothetical protein